MKQDTGKLHQLTFSLAIIGLLITISGNFYHNNSYTSLSYLIGALILLVLASQFLFYISTKCDGIILGFLLQNRATETLRFTETLLKHFGYFLLPVGII